MSCNIPYIYEYEKYGDWRRIIKCFLGNYNLAAFVYYEIQTIDDRVLFGYGTLFTHCWMDGKPVNTQFTNIEAFVINH